MFDISGMGLCIGRVFNVVKAPISVVKVEVKKGLDFKDNFIKFMRLTFKNVFKKITQHISLVYLFDVGCLDPEITPDTWENCLLVENAKVSLKYALHQQVCSFLMICTFEIFEGTCFLLSKLTHAGSQVGGIARQS